MKKTKNIVIKKGCHSQESLLGISLIRNRKQVENFCLKTTKQKGDPRQKPSGMTPLWNGGFTLIELLVVVLIIGILAAVAVPQYQKAVDRARATEAVELIASLQKAVDVWILAHPGESARLLKENSTQHLDIDIPCQYDAYGEECWVNKNVVTVEIEYDPVVSILVYAFCYYTDDAYVFMAAMKNMDDGTWTHKCGYFNDRGKGICEGLQGYEIEEGFEI